MSVFLRVVCTKSIRAYQRWGSWDHRWRRVFSGARQCRYYPSCSDYALGCFERLSFARAARLSVLRVLRCTPLSLGGVDEPPAL